MRPDVAACSAPPPLSQLPMSQEALEHLFREAGGPFWLRKDSWNDKAADLSKWYGVTVKQGRVVKLDLPNNNLIGKACSCAIFFIFPNTPSTTTSIFSHKFCSTPNRYILDTSAFYSRLYIYMRSHLNIDRRVSINVGSAWARKRLMSSSGEFLTTSSWVYGRGVFLLASFDYRGR